MDSNNFTKASTTQTNNSNPNIAPPQIVNSDQNVDPQNTNRTPTYQTPSVQEIQEKVQGYNYDEVHKQQVTPSPTTQQENQTSAGRIPSQSNSNGAKIGLLIMPLLMLGSLVGSYFYLETGSALRQAEAYPMEFGNYETLEAGKTIRAGEQLIFVCDRKNRASDLATEAKFRLKVNEEVIKGSKDGGALIEGKAQFNVNTTSLPEGDYNAECQFCYQNTCTDWYPVCPED